MEGMKKAPATDYRTNDEVIVGFDPIAVPVIRRALDDSILLIFSALPRFFADSNRARKEEFVMDAFGKNLKEAVGGAIVWDDRAVFVLEKPDHACFGRLRLFLSEFSRPESRPWLKWFYDHLTSRQKQTGL
jgi:hypothetical protein